MNTEYRKMVDEINQKLNELNALYHYAANWSGVSDTELSVWSVLLNSSEQYSQQNLSEILCLPKQTVNSLISGFVKNHYVTLEHVPGTRNRKVILLTESGRSYGKSKTDWIFEAEDHAINAASPDELRMSVEMLGNYIRLFRRKLYESADSPMVEED